MKDSKRIDNKAKSRRIAAYALAGCMAVTAAPMTMPGMGPEVVKAAYIGNITQAVLDDSGARVTFTVDQSAVKADTTYANVAKNIKLMGAISLSSDSTQDGDYTFAKSAASVAIYKADGTTLVWDTEGNTNVPGTTKIGYDTEYKIVATFKTSVKVDGADILATSGTVDKYGNVTAKQFTIAKKYTTTPMLINGDNPKLVHDDGSGTPEDLTDSSYDGLYNNDKGTWLIVNGVTRTHTAPTVEKNKDGSWYVETDGKVDLTKTGIVPAVEKTGGKTYTGLEVASYYVVNGKVDYKFTGVVEDAGKWYNVVKGKVSTTPTVVKAPNGKWVYFDTAGEHKFATYSTKVFAKNDNGVWILDNGVVDFTVDEFISTGTNDPLDADGSDAAGLDDGSKYYVSGGKVQLNTTGYVFAEEAGERTVKYVRRGKVDSDVSLTKPTLVKDNQTGVWYLVGTDGNVYSGHAGLYENQYGTWYVDADGEVDFDKTVLAGVDANNEFIGYGSAEAIYFVKNGKVQKNKSGILLNSELGTGTVGAAAYLEKGEVVVDTDINESIIKAADGKWYYVPASGLIDNNTDIVAANKNGVWIVEDSVVEFEGTGFAEIDTDAIEGYSDGDIVYFKDGKLQKDFSGVAVVKNTTITNGSITNLNGVGTAGTKFVKNGVEVTETSYSEPTVIKGTDGKWYYIDENGFNSSFEGMATNVNGTWYCKAGIVDFSANGIYLADAGTDDQKAYYVVNGKLAKDVNGIKDAHIINTTINDAKLYKVNLENGVSKAGTETNNVVKAADGKWYYVNTFGIVNTAFSGLAENKNGVWAIKNGVVDFTAEGIKSTSSNVDSKKVTDFDELKVYVKGGKVQFDFTGAIMKDGVLTYFEKGRVSTDTDPCVVTADDGKMYYMENGTIATTYQGLAKASDGVIWYVYNGIVVPSRTGIIVQNEDVAGTKLEAGEYYVEKGQLKTDKTGLVADKADKVYVEKGQVVKDLEVSDSVIKIDGKWYNIDATGRVAAPSDHLAGNKNGIWYIKDNGEVDFTHKGLVTTAPNSVLDKIASGSLVYVSGGKFQDEAECVVVDTARTLTKYVKNGVVDEVNANLKQRTAVKGTDNKWYGVETTGAIMSSAGLAKTEDGVAYVAGSDGIIDFRKTTLVGISANADNKLIGFDDTTSRDVYVKNGMVQIDTTGIVTVSSNVGASESISSATKIYVKKGIATKAKDVNGSYTDDTLVLGADDVMYYTGNNSYVVNTAKTGIIGMYHDRLYYVVNGKVNTSYSSSSKVLDDSDDVLGGGNTKKYTCKIIDGAVKDPVVVTP